MSATPKVPTLFSIRKKIAEKSYYEFFKQAWYAIEPETPLQDTWHIEYLCNRLQQEIERIKDRKPKKKDILINIMPRSLKSRIVTVFLNVWAWINYPHLKFISVSCNEDLAGDLSTLTKKLFDSDWFQRRWGEKVKLSKDTKAKLKFSTTSGGFRNALGIGATITGKGGDCNIIDDPIDPKKTDSESLRKECNKWFDQTFYSRLNDPKIGVRIIVMQRLHEEDLSGYVLEKYGDKFEHICIPAELNETSADVSPPELKQKYTDNLFFPSRFDREVLDDYKTVLGSLGYANQVLQKPSPAEGIIYKRKWFTRRWNVLPKFDELIQSWDMAFKDKSTSSKVVGQVWGRMGALYFLIDQVRDNLDFIATINAFVNLTAQYPSAYTKLVEDKANGPAIISTLKNKIPGIIPVPKDASKEAMAYSVTPAWESGNIILPNSQWIDDFIEEHCNFPNAKHDDQCDTSAQAIKYFMDKPGNFWKNIIQL